MKRIAIVLTTLIMITFAFSACTNYSAEPAEEELTVIRGSLGTDSPSVYILYNRHEAAAYLLGVAENGYVILKRSNSTICEEGEKNPYEGYMELKKYYREILSYTVYDPSMPDTPFHNLNLDTYGATYSEAAKRNEIKPELSD